MNPVVKTVAEGTLNMAVPLLFAALGGLFSERGGVVNIALEGLMLVGAFVGAVVGVKTGSPVLALLAGMAAGTALAGLHAWSCVVAGADHVISGVAINLLASGGTVFLSQVVFRMKGGSPGLGSANMAPWAGFSPLVYAVFLLVPVVGFVVFRTVFGLRLRAVGEHPRAADTVGIPVARIRITGVLLSGLLASLGGLFLVFNAGSFTKDMTAGRGYIALAALIFGKWRPGGVLAACLLFGMAQSLQMNLQGHADLLLTALAGVPYAVLLLALVALLRRKWAQFGTCAAVLILIVMGKVLNRILPAKPANILEKLGASIASFFNEIPVLLMSQQFIQMLPYVVTLVVLAGFIGKATAPAALGQDYRK